MKRLIPLCLIFTLKGISIVYNLRIAEATKRQREHISTYHLKPSIASLTLLNLNRKTYNNIHQNVAGGLITLLSTYKQAYIRLDTAAAHNKQKLPELGTRARTQIDDLLFSGGYSFKSKQHARMTLSGLLGIPTHRDTGFLCPEIGTGHVGLGGQFDASCFYRPHYAVLGAVRFIHFFPRKTSLLAPTCRTPDFHLGNLADLFIAHQCNWQQHHWEIGYNPTFAFDAHFCPALPTLRALVNQIGFIRSSFYTSYLYRFLIRHHGSALILGFSYSFDHRPKDFGIKRGVTLWGTWGINF